MSQEIIDAVYALADPDYLPTLNRFFKQGPGEYAEGDCFIGVRVPQLRALARNYRDLSESDYHTLIQHPVHEVRLLAVILLADQAANAQGDTLRRLVERYLTHLKGVNNWDLVDLSAPYLLGRWVLEDMSRFHQLVDLCEQDALWSTRVAIVATWPFIKAGELEPVLRLFATQWHQTHDLLHKALGWMLREVGKVDHERLKSFLREEYNAMSRTTLRYAIERFSVEERRQYLNGAFSHA